MELCTEYALLKLPLDSNHSQLDIANRKEVLEISVTDTRQEQIKTKQSNVWTGTIIVSLLILVIILSCTIGVLVYQMHFENKINGTKSTWDAEFKENCSFSDLRAELCIESPNATNDQENGCKLCPANWKLYQENCYLISNNIQIKSWNDSQTYCIGMKSHLLVIENKEQMQEFFGELVYKDASYWIGLYFDNKIRNWTWVNCETCKDFQLNFKNTRPGDTDNHCVLRSNSYHSENCNSPHSWICQRKAIRL